MTAFIGILTYNTHLFWKTPARILDRFGIRLLYADETCFTLRTERLRRYWRRQHEIHVEG